MSIEQPANPAEDAACTELEARGGVRSAVDCQALRIQFRPVLEPSGPPTRGVRWETSRAASTAWVGTRTGTLATATSNAPKRVGLERLDDTGETR
jgi:hypothetical protein